jgi:hypothetical protein
MEAAKQGYAIAASNVAVEYSTGTGAVEQNLATGECIEYITRAAPPFAAYSFFLL